jgi:cell division protein FtsX
MNIETIGLWGETAWYVRLLFNLLMVALPTLAGIALLSASGTKVVSTARSLLQTVRPAVDQPTDPIVLLIAQKTGRTPDEVCAWLAGNIDVIIAALPAKQEAVR